MMRTLKLIASGLVVFASVTAALNAGWLALREFNDKLNFEDAALITNQRLLDMQDRVIEQAHRGQVFRVAFSIDRKLSCEAIVQNSLLVKQADASITEMYNFNYSPFRWVTAGKYETQEILQVPEWLPVGKYVFQRQVKYSCAGKAPAYFTFAHLDLEILP